MVKIGKKEKNGELYKAILLLKDEQECYEFFQDLCTVSELRAMEQRFEVASLLDRMLRSECDGNPARHVADEKCGMVSACERFPDRTSAHEFVVFQQPMVWAFRE